MNSALERGDQAGALCSSPCGGVLQSASLVTSLKTGVLCVFLYPATKPTASSPGICFLRGGPHRAGQAARRINRHGVATPKGDPHIVTLKREDQNQGQGQNQSQSQNQIRVNDQIRARQIRVIDENGEQLGIMAPRDALREAEQRGFDLVEVAPKAAPPVCRIMDYGKYRYEQKRRARESRQNQHQITATEITFRPKIDKHDFEFKTNHVREFLAEGNKVKLTIMFRGREVAHPEFGREILKGVVEATADLCTGDYRPMDARLEGKNMSLVLTPTKQA